MAQPGTPADTLAPTLSSFLERLERLETEVAEWDEAQRTTVHALREAVDALHKEAFLRIIRGLRTDPVAASALREVVGDEVVYAVLRHLQLIKPSLNERLEQALASVRPLLREHGGDVELVRLDPPDTVELRLIGTCQGCPSANLTLTEGIEKAIKEHCPEIATIHRSAAAPALDSPPAGMTLISPFAREGWQVASALGAIPEGGFTAIQVGGRALLFSRRAGTVRCYDNACAHLGLPLSGGSVSDGILICPHHGFQYDLDSGRCLTAPDVHLGGHPVRVIGTTVEVKLP